MKNNLILFGLFFALLHAMSTEEADADDASLTIYVDAGKDINNFLRLAKTIEEKQSLIDDALKSLSSEIKALKERMTAEAKATQERWNERMTAEAKATEERWNERLSEAIKSTEGRMSAEITKMNKKVVELSSQLAKSSNVATPQKRPAELACEKITNDLRSIGETTFYGIPNSFQFWLYNSDNQPKFCRGALIDKRFLITAVSYVSTDKYTKVKVDSVRKEIKAVHIHPDFSSETPSLNNIALIELESDVGYTPGTYPMCLYTSQVNPERDLMEYFGKIQIIADANCANKTGTHLKPSQICAKNLKYEDTFPGLPIYEVQENFPKPKLFGIVATEARNFEPYMVTKVFDHLNFIESIVWPKSGY